MLFIKVHKSYRNVVAICDSDLIGKHFEQEELQLDLKESFYKGEKYSEDQALKIIKDYAKEDVTFNIVGKKAIEICLKAGCIIFYYF
jgi:uncharacterized protein